MRELPNPSRHRKDLALDPAKPPTLLWIDDYAPGLALYRAMFEMFGFKVLTAGGGAEGIRILLANQVDIIVTDYEMPRVDGELVAMAVKALNPKTPVVLYSGSTLVPDRCRRLVDAVCDKARPRTELLAAIHSLLQKKHSRGLQPPVPPRASDQGHRTVA
jgi:CheY-like chemotaxis protein